jgi:HEXXH motif-containing protein
MQFEEAFLYPTPLSPEQGQRVRELLDTRLALQLDWLVGLVQQPQALSKLGARAPELQSLLAEVFELTSNSPALASEFFSHWSTPLMLSRLLAASSLAPEQVHYLLGNLTSLLIHQRLHSGATRGNARFITPSAIYCLARGQRLWVRGRPDSAGRILWEFSGAQVTLREEAGGAPFLKLPLPLQEGTPLEWVPLPVSRRWNALLLEDSHLLDISGRRLEYEIPNDGTSGSWAPLSLEESVDGAHRILAELWPEVLTWADILLPALVDMGGPENKTVRCSASYGARTPIFLSRVGHPFEHAEDLVHELQHERLYLLLDSRDFGLWNDERQLFVSPYRTDLRPLQGVLLGLHSFLAVDRLRLLAMERRPELFLSEWRFQLIKSHRSNLLAFLTLHDFEQPTATGRRLLAAIARELSAQHAPIQAVADERMDQRFDAGMRSHFSAVSAGAALNAAERYMDWREAAAVAARYAQEHGEMS